MLPSETLSGIVPILMTPVLEDEGLDIDSMRRQVEFLLGVGITALGFGFASEGLRSTDAENDAALRVVVDQVGGRALTFAHVTAGSTAAAIERVKVAAALGAGAVMLPAPILASSSEDVLFSYYAAVASETATPIIVQDAAFFSGPEFSVGLLERLAREIDQVVALKVESVPSAPKIGHVVEAVGDAAVVLGGGSGIDFLHELERGAGGTMPGPAFTDHFSRIWSLFSEGHVRESRQLFHALLPILVLTQRSLDTFLFTEKEVLTRNGVFASAKLRAPAPDPDAALVGEIETLLRELDVAAKASSGVGVPGVKELIRELPVQVQELRSQGGR